MSISRKLLVFGLIALVGLLLSGPLFADDPELARKSTLNQIVQRGQVLWCSDVPFEPFEFEDDQGNLVGYDVDMVRMMAKQIFDDADAHRVVITGFDVIIPALNDRNCDIIASAMTRTLQRALSVNFSEGYLETGQVALVSRTKAPGRDVRSYSDLDNPIAIITVQLGTTGEEAARNAFPNAQIRAFPTAPAALQEVLDGRADAIIFDDTFLLPTFQQPTVANRAFLCCPRVEQPDPDIEVLRAQLSLLTVEVLAFAHRPGDPDFNKWLDLFVIQMKTTIIVNVDIIQEFELDSKEVGQPFLDALQRKWGFKPPLKD
jgi:polar amino acid transport system substrate-binding protein